MPVGAQHDIVRCQTISRDEKSQIAFDQALLVFGQSVVILLQRDIGRHVDFLRHPVVRAGGKVFFPCLFVLERHQLVYVRLAVDDALVSDADTPGGSGCDGMSVPVQDYGCLLRKAIAVQCRAMRMLGVMWPADSLTPSWRSRARLYAWESSSGVGTARICSELWFMVWSCNFIL